MILVWFASVRFSEIRVVKRECGGGAFRLSVKRWDLLFHYPLWWKLSRNKIKNTDEQPYLRDRDLVLLPIRLRSPNEKGRPFLATNDDERKAQEEPMRGRELKLWIYELRLAFLSQSTVDGSHWKDLLSPRQQTRNRKVAHPSGQPSSYTTACLQIFYVVPLCSLWAFRIYMGNRFMFCKPCWWLVLFWMVQSYKILNNVKWGSLSSVALSNGRLIVLCFYDPSACKLGSTVTLIEFSGLPCGLSAMLWPCLRSPDVRGLFICFWIVVTRQSLYGTWLPLMVFFSSW